MGRMRGEVGEDSTVGSRWELLVVGGGSAGLTAARTARMLGARVLLVEKARLGGDCLWTGCIPSKALIAQARDATLMGTDSTALTAALDRARAARDQIAPTDSAPSLRRAGVTVLPGEALFDGPDSVTIGGRRLHFERAVLATGSRPIVPAITGLEEAAPLTTETLWDVPELPGRLLVIGGGPVGCELGQALARLGVEVTIVHRGADILPQEEPQARATVAATLRADGVHLVTGRTVSRVERRDGAGGGTAVLDDAARVPFERVLVATGRRAAADGLGLERAGIRRDTDGWVVRDRALRTTNPSVWVAGDVTTLPKHTHTAGVSGAIAARNALLGSRKTIDVAATPWVTFTSPEVASVGVRAAGRDPRRHRVVTMPHRHVDRAVAEDDTDGYTQLVVDARGRIRGGTIVGPRAGESIGELALAVRMKATVGSLAAVTHPYPTFNDGLWNAVIMQNQRRLVDGWTGRAAGMLRRIHRVRHRRAADAAGRSAR